MPVPDGRRPVDRHLLRDTAYRELCDAIVTGVLAPGEALHDGQLCAWLGLSRTPVRAALARLEDEGLVEMAPQRYTRVAPLTVGDVHETMPVLAAVHALAAELAVSHLTPDDLDELESANRAFVAALRAGDGPGAYAADDRFHDVFTRAAGNTEITRILERLAGRLHRLERVAAALPGRRSVAQHQAIISRAATGDAHATASAARANWMTLGTVLETSLAPR